MSVSQTNIHTHTCTPQDTAPDVVYAFTPGAPMAVSVRTCGSGYDTVLLLGRLQPGLPAAQQLQLADTLANDDDPSCVSPGNPAAGSNSRIDTVGGRIGVGKDKFDESMSISTC